MSDDVNTLGARMAEAYERGGHTAAEPYAEQILAKVDRWYLRSHRDALYLRARVRHVLSQAADDRGDHDAARTHIADGMSAAGRAAALGDPRVAFETVMLLIARAEQHLVTGDTAAASADHDAALTITDPLGHPMWWEAQVHLRLGRAWVRQQTGELDLAEAEVRDGLALASEHEPRLVSLCLDRLAMLRRLAGASGVAEHHLAAAEVIAATQPLDATRRAERAGHAASSALEKGDAETAARQLDEAERTYLAVGDQRRAAGTAAARVEVLRLRGDTAEAIDEARRAVERCRAVGERVGEAEAHTVLGLALDDAGRSEEALAAHSCARALVTEPIELVRVDVRRAVAAFNAAVRRANGTRAAAPGTVAPAGSAERFETAVDIAVPCALAAEAIRFGMPAGELREAWAGEVSRRIIDSALQMLTVADRGDEILDLLEHVAASAALDPVQVDPGSPWDQAGLDLLATPPRIRSMPGESGALEWAFRAVQERYGFAARTDEVVDAW